VIGAGGLGCPALLALSTVDAPWPLTIVDPDVVAPDNLQRQVLFTLADVGANKAQSARLRLRARRPELAIETVRERMDAPTLTALLDALPPGSIVLECTDDPALKFLANDLCRGRGIPLVIGGVVGVRGQAIAVAGDGACYRCLFEAPPPPELAPACERVGVLGSAAGVIGHAMAALALGLAGGVSVGGELFDWDLRTTTLRTLRPPPRPGCTACDRAPAPQHVPRRSSGAASP
jgi:adenylyltransferase/sulfurtransferase